MVAMSYDSRLETHTHIGEVRRRLLAVVRDLLSRADRHDASKLVPPEVEASMGEGLDHQPMMRRTSPDTQDQLVALALLVVGLAQLPFYALGRWLRRRR